MAGFKALIRRLLSTSPDKTNSSLPDALEMAWSKKTYGPDGPWQAITVDLGTPPRAVDLFPGLWFWGSVILSETICANTSISPTCYAQSGFYNPANSSTNTTLSSFDLTFITSGPSDHIPFVGRDTFVEDLALFRGASTTFTVPNFGMMVFSNGYGVLPNGVKCTQEVGLLSLENTTLSGILNAYPATLLSPSSLAPSNSYGMHIGSVSLKIPGSLYIGGYDQARVLGPVTTQKSASIQLLDIGISFAEDDSPLSYSSRTGLLAQGNTSIGNMFPVAIDPNLPYLYLPQSTCKALSQDLPITYEPTVDLYIWDTENPQYTEILRSSAFLSFVFQSNESTEQNLTIKVSLALLNLTLMPPITAIPAQYFPCQSFSFGNIDGSGSYRLGRAFLQAAFFGQNWNANGTWFLAQAPGPNISSPAPVSIAADTLEIFGSSKIWEDSWRPYWQSLKANSANSGIPVSSNSSQGPMSFSNTSSTSHSNTSQSTSSHSDHGIPDGAIVGISASGIACLAFIIFVWYGLKKRKPATPPVKKSFVVLRPEA